MAKIFSVLLVSILVAASPFVAGEVLPAARIDNATTTASFTLGLSLAGHTNYAPAALITDDVHVTGIIVPAPEQAGQQADIFVVVQVGNVLFMRTQGGSFVPWDGNVPTLLPFQARQTLTSAVMVDFYTGKH